MIPREVPDRRIAELGKNTHVRCPTSTVESHTLRTPHADLVVVLGGRIWLVPVQVAGFGPEDDGIAGSRAGGGMAVWQYAMWGFFGGFAVDGLDFAGAIRRVGGWPWRQPGNPGPLEFGVSVLIRVGVAGGLTAAAASTDQVSGPFGAVAVGVSAPLLIQQLARQVPVTNAPAEAEATTSSTGGPQSASDPQPGDVQAGNENAS
jgi:hypothetical protein